MPDRVERRRGRRVDLQAPLHVRPAETSASEPFTEHQTKNISLAGVYFETHDGGRYAVNQVLVTSVSVPEAQRREFPFTRIAGLSRVVRVHALSTREAAGPGHGIALEFGDDVMALTALPTRG